MSTRMQGRVTVGPTASPDVTVGGEGVLNASQTGLLNVGGTLVQDLPFVIPLGSDITDIVVDILTAWDSVTSATLSVGSASGGIQFASAINAKTVGRVRPTFTAAQLAALIALAATGVVATVTSVGQPTVGQARITIHYRPGAN